MSFGGRPDGTSARGNDNDEIYLKRAEKFHSNFYRRREKPGPRQPACCEAVRNVGRNAISTTMSFSNLRYFRFLKAAMRVDITFWTASGPSWSYTLVAGRFGERYGCVGGKTTGRAIHACPAFVVLTMDW